VPMYLFVLGRRRAAACTDALVNHPASQVDASVIDFFIPAAERLLSSEQPSRVLAAALAALGGFRRAPQPRSLLTYEEGMVTLRLLGTPGGCGHGCGCRSSLIETCVTPPCSGNPMI
jgi:hypothetical protein